MDLELDELRDDLIERWKAAFDRLPEVETEVEGERVTQIVYTQYPAFALSNYTPRKFKPGARVSRQPSPDGDDYVFDLDARARPLRVRFEHRINRVNWRGIYHYRADEVEHIEFCMQTGVPSLYNRLLLSGECVLAEQRFVCNGGGSVPRWKGQSPSATIDEILKEPYHRFIYVTLYQIENGVTQSGREYHEVAGSIQRPTLEYSYSVDGKLLRIVQHWPSGEARTVFAAKTKTTLAALSQRLSERIASEALRQVRSASLEAPVIALALSYRNPDQPIPILIPATEKDDVSDVHFAARIDPKRWIALREEDFAPEIVEFGQRVEAEQRVSALSRMLRAAARRVTLEAGSALPVAKGFIAFAIDWELEGHEMAKILKECGATPQQLREWKENDWF
jgi:hypothetical protein